jgi:flagellar motor switch protein FliN/FliY
MDLEELKALGGIPLEVDVELDRRILSVRQILHLEPGSVVRMNRPAGENIDVLIGRALIGFGEIVIIEDRMGVRITAFNVEE